MATTAQAWRIFGVWCLETVCLDVRRYRMLEIDAFRREREVVLTVSSFTRRHSMSVTGGMSGRVHGDRVLFCVLDFHFLSRFFFHKNNRSCLFFRNWQCPNGKFRFSVLNYLMIRYLRGENIMTPCYWVWQNHYTFSCKKLEFRHRLKKLINMT